MLAGPSPFLPSHQVTIQVGVPPAVAASARAVGDRSAILSVNVRLVPSSPTEASRMSRAGWFALATGTTENGASPAASGVQLPGGNPCVPATNRVPPLREADVMLTFAGVGSGSGLPWAANRLGPVASRITALIGLPMYSVPVIKVTSDRSLLSL